jgi:hypothetical protein
MTSSTLLSKASSLLAPFARVGGPWGIAADVGSTLLGVGASLLSESTSSATHIERVHAAAPLVAAALVRADAEKARLAAGGDPRS